MANRLNWSLGHEGNGNWYKNGDISTWNIDEVGDPHHHEIATQEMNDPDVQAHEPGFFFYVSPQGGVHDGGIGFNNQTPKTDDQVVSEIIAQDPQLYDARNEDFDQAAAPRVELSGGGYGHAQNLLDILSKISKEEGWADFHTELKLPRSVRKKIRRWVDRLKWPEGSEKADARTYHITILSMDEYDDDFAKWARKEMRGRYFTFKTTGLDIFAGEHVVLRMECPEWTDLVRKWTGIADDQGLKPRKFEPPKAHVTVGKSPSGKWPQGVPDPHIRFDAREFNINKNSSDILCNVRGETQKQSTEETIADELRSWLQARKPTRPLPAAQPPSIHHTDADQFMPEVVAPASVGPHVDPPSKPYEPYNWADHGWEESPLNRVAAETHSQLVRKGLRMDELLGPDNAQPVHEFPDGWSVRQLQNYGDVEREGRMMNNCLIPRHPGEVGVAHNVWGEHPEAIDPEYAEDEYPDENREGRVPEGYDRSAPLRQWKIYSLRDPDNVPHLTEDGSSMLGRHNADPSDEYFDYMARWRPDYYVAPEQRHLHESSTRTCAQCGEEIDGPICSVCGYDPSHADSDYEASKANWYERAWDNPGNQPRPVPNQPMHWRHDNATDIKFAATSDQQDTWHMLGNGPVGDLPDDRHLPTGADRADISAFSTLSVDNSINGWREV